MSSLPMYFPPAPFQLAEVILCSTLVDAAYDMYSSWKQQDKPDAKNFTWTPPASPSLPALHYSQPIWGAETELWIFTHREPFAFVAWTDDGSVYLAIRGTESVDDWVSDADIDQASYDLASGYGKVHDGFLKLYKTMGDAVLQALTLPPDPKRLFITGHSLGSGLATLAVPHIITRSAYTPRKLPVVHYNLASPRVGDPTFASTYNANQVPTYRIVNTSDAVPELPASVFGHLVYQHVGTPVDYTAHYGSLAGNHSAHTSYRYALDHPDQPQREAAVGSAA